MSPRRHPQIAREVRLELKGGAELARLRTRGRRRRRGRVLLAACGMLALLLAACSRTTGTVITPAPLDASVSLFAIGEATSCHTSVGCPGLVAYRARDGATRWTYTPSSGRFVPNSRLLYHAELVFGYTWDGDIEHPTLVAVRASDGKPLWQLRVSGILPLPIALGDGYVVIEQDEGTSPQAVTHLLVYRTSDGGLAYDMPLAETTTIAADGATGYACNRNAVLTAFRLSDGQALWRTPVDAERAIPNRFCNLEAAVGGIAYCLVDINPSASGPAAGLRQEIVAVRGSDGHALWRQPSVGIPTVTQGRLFLPFPARIVSGVTSNATLSAFNVTDGTLLWEIPTPGADTPFVVATADTVTFPQQMALTALRASDGTNLWQYQSPGRYVTPTAATGGVVFAVTGFATNIRTPVALGTDTNAYLVALSAANGSLYWQIPIDVSGLVVSADT